MTYRLSADGGRRDSTTPIYCLQCRLPDDRSADPHSVPGGHVDEGVFEKCGEDEEKTHDHPDVDGFDVGDLRQLGVDSGALRGRRQDRQQSDGDPGRNPVYVDPEGDPGEDDDEDAGHEHLDDEETNVPTQDELDLLT